MIPISGVIIAFNEEIKIGRCITSLQKVCDEVVVVDSRSSDNTVVVSKRLGARVIIQPFLGYVDQKNFALDQAKYDWVLSLDADEELSDELVQEIKKIKEKQKADGYKINRLNNFCGQWIYGCGWYPDRKLRLFDKTKGKWAGINPHDKIEMNKEAILGIIDKNIVHYTYDTREGHVEQTFRFANISANHMKILGRKSNLLKIYLKPPFRFFRDYIFKLGFIDGYYGLVISWYNAKGVYLKYKILSEIKDKP